MLGHSLYLSLSKSRKENKLDKITSHTWKNKSAALLQQLPQYSDKVWIGPTPAIIVNIVKIITIRKIWTAQNVPIPIIGLKLAENIPSKLNRTPVKKI